MKVDYSVLTSNSTSNPYLGVEHGMKNEPELEDYDNHFPSDEFVLVKNVPIFDEHEGARTVKGKPLKVDSKVLQEIADNMNHKFKTKKTTCALSLGHTIDGAKEEDQPTVAGWAVNFRVLPFLRTGKKALYADWYIKRKYKNVIEEYPGRSVEYWPARAEISPCALLKSTVPERDLPVIKFNAEKDDVYRYSISTSTTQGPIVNPETPNPVVVDAQKNETSSSKGLEAKVDALTQTLQSFISMFTEAMNGGEGEDDKDLLAPAEGEDQGEDKGGEEEPKPKDKKDKGKPKEEPIKEEKGDEDGEEPEDYSASQPCATNGTIPSMSKTETKKKDEVTKMSREVEIELVKYKRETEKLAKDNAEFKLKFQKMRAEKMVQDWETKDHIQFPTPEDRESEIEMMAHLDDESLLLHEKRAKKLYSRKTPNGEAVAEVQKYARTPEDKPKEGSMEEAQKLASEALKFGSYEAYLQSKAKK